MENAYTEPQGAAPDFRWDKRYTQCVEAIETLHGGTKVLFGHLKDMHGTTFCSLEGAQRTLCTQFFRRIYLNIGSILRLLPGPTFPPRPNHAEALDYSALCMIARGIMDSYIRFFYLAIYRIDANEKIFRFTLWRLHATKEIKRWIPGEKPESLPDNIDLEVLVASHLESITTNAFFLTLPEKERRRIEDRMPDVALKFDEISQRAGIPPDFRQKYHEHLSQFVHAFPYSFAQLDKFHACHASALEITSTLLASVVALLGLTIRDTLSIFHEHADAVDNAVKQLISENW
ncbi:hypothetical protein HYR69_07215 [Candidatus Sumerlaeota bacterium]|nr:hypothetical protein [Candidatus Sumerlaeota bacterium]